MVDIDTSELDRYLDRKCKLLEETMLEYCKQEINRTLDSHIDSGETSASMVVEQNGLEGSITVGGAAVWLEFGTGVKYNKGLHPMAKELGMYSHGMYQSNKDTPPKRKGASKDGWVYEKNGEFFHTYGIRQTRFMYNAGKTVKKNILKIARRVFS